MKQWKKNVVALSGASLFGLATFVYADPAPAIDARSSQSMAQRMMGGHGPEMIGRGMMGGHGHDTMGRGIAGGHDHDTMRRGMMSGHGPEMMGRGISGGHGSTAPGARGMGLATMLEGLDLSSEQRAQIQPLDDELFRKQWEITGNTIEAQRKLRRQSSTQQRDDNAIAEAHKILRELREQRLLAGLQTREKLTGILTQEQRERLRLREQSCRDRQA